MRPAGEHFVRELDRRRSENLVRETHYDRSRLAFITALHGSKELVPRWPTAFGARREILYDFEGAGHGSRSGGPETSSTLVLPMDGASGSQRDSSPLAQPRASSLDELRAAMTDAIRDRAWRVVEIIQGKIDDMERPANVVPMVAPRRGRP